MLSWFFGRKLSPHHHWQSRGRCETDISPTYLEWQSPSPKDFSLHFLLDNHQVPVLAPALCPTPAFWVVGALHTPSLPPLSHPFSQSSLQEEDLPLCLIWNSGVFWQSSFAQFITNFLNIWSLYAKLWTLNVPLLKLVTFGPKTIMSSCQKCCKHGKVRFCLYSRRLLTCVESFLCAWVPSRWKLQTLIEDDWIFIGQLWRTHALSETVFNVPNKILSNNIYFFFYM